MKVGDRVPTPDWCARDMVRYFSPSGKILEPCSGDGAIIRYIPGADWCEIDRGRDFFDWTEPVDWILTNPPYSIMRSFLRHALSVAEEVVFLVPARNVFSGYGTVREAYRTGHRMVAIRWYGTGGRLGFPMGNAIAALHWSRTGDGRIVETFYEDGDGSRAP